MSFSCQQQQHVHVSGDNCDNTDFKNLAGLKKTWCKHIITVFPCSTLQSSMDRGFFHALCPFIYMYKLLLITKNSFLGFLLDFGKGFLALFKEKSSTILLGK